jgi:hypothetical protein
MSFINQGAFRTNVKGGDVIYWAIVLTFLWPLAFIAILSGPFGLVVIGIWPVLLLWGLSAALAVVFVIDFTTKRDWLRASAMLPLPLTVVLAIVTAYFNTDFAIYVINRARDDLQLLVTLPTYSREISNLPRHEGPRLATFLWRDLNGFGLAFGYEFLVYDESDEIALPAEKRSADWKKHAGRDLECKSTEVHHAFGHYYFVGHGVDC